MVWLARFIWSVFPYMCLTVMIVGTFFRYQADQLRWTAISRGVPE